MPVFLAYLLLINVTSLVAFGVDKRRSRRGEWRTAERSLLALAMLGGSPGALLAMWWFRHKTRKLRFQLAIGIIVTLQLGLGYWWVSRGPSMS
jgi:uncharacterized membrane protein YsdA (DUF1294 family)